MKLSRILAFAVASTVALMGMTANPASATVSGVTDCKFGVAQVFDVQWNINGSTLNISGVTRPYGTEVGQYGGQLAARDWVDGYYVKFVESTSVPGTLALERFNARGNSLGLLDDTGTFQALGDDFIFYLGGGSWGTVITTGQGYEYGSSAALEISNSSPTADDVRAYTNCVGVPLEAGQSREDAGNGGGGNGGGNSAVLALNLNVEIGEPIAGKKIDYSGEGLEPESDYVLELHSTVYKLGDGVTDAEGNFSSTVRLPAGVEPGPHEIVLKGTDPSGKAVTRTAYIYVGETGLLLGKSMTRPFTEEEMLAMTGVDSNQLALIALVAASAIGAGVVLTARRRRRTSH